MPAGRGSPRPSPSPAPRPAPASASRPAAAPAPKTAPSASTRPSPSAASRVSPGMSQAAQNTRAETQRNIQEGLSTVGRTLSLAEAQQQARLRGVSTSRITEEARNQGLSVGSRLQERGVSRLLRGTEYGRTIGTDDVRDIAARTGATRQEVLSSAQQLAGRSGSTTRLGSNARQQAARLSERRQETRAANGSANTAGTRNVGGANVLQLPDTATFLNTMIDALSSRQSVEADARNATANVDIADLESRTRERVADINLQGIRSQSDAARYASEQSAGATRFAATEGARGQIETQRVSSESQERQIGLTGEQERQLEQERGRQTRETDLQREMFRRYEEQRNYDQARSAMRA